ncbi:MAG: hypothetical protein ACE5HO_15710, partial [bacterium]
KSRATVRALSHPSDFRSGQAKICLPSKGELALAIETIALRRGAFHGSSRKEVLPRAASVQQLAGDLQHYLNGMPVLARKDTLRYRSAKFVQRHGEKVRFIQDNRYYAHLGNTAGALALQKAMVHTAGVSEKRHGKGSNNNGRNSVRPLSRFSQRNLESIQSCVNSL